jgi:hypothetical protein
MVTIESPSDGIGDTEKDLSQFDDVAHVVVLEKDTPARAVGIDHAYRIPLSRFPDDFEFGDEFDGDAEDGGRAVFEPGDEIPIEVARELGFNFYQSDPDHFALFDDDQNRLDQSTPGTSEAARKFRHGG